MKYLLAFLLVLSVGASAAEARTVYYRNAVVEVIIHPKRPPHRPGPIAQARKYMSQARYDLMMAQRALGRTHHSHPVIHQCPWGRGRCR